MKVTGLTVVIAAAIAAVLYLDHLPPSRLASLLGISLTVSDLQNSPTPSPSQISEPTGDRSPDELLSTVAIQTFSGPTLVRTAAGTVVSSDGLVVTTTAGAPFGSGANVYQVVTSKGSFLRARRIAFDAVAGLVLLKADGEDLEAESLGEVPSLGAGDALTVLGATVSLSRYSPIILPATVAYLAGPTDPVLSLDRSLLHVLVGARVVDRTGKMVGLLNQVGTVKVINAATIDAFVRRNLSAQ